MNSPIGIYKKQELLSHTKIVYHYAEGDYHLYKRGEEWIVSILKLTITTS